MIESRVLIEIALRKVSCCSMPELVVLDTPDVLPARYGIQSR
jgi:hypothetical protein